MLGASFLSHLFGRSNSESVGEAKSPHLRSDFRRGNLVIGPPVLQYPPRAFCPPISSSCSDTLGSETALDPRTTPQSTLPPLYSYPNVPLSAVHGQQPVSSTPINGTGINAAVAAYKGTLKVQVPYLPGPVGHSFPLQKPLSPIAEQDYISPSSTGPEVSTQIPSPLVTASTSGGISYSTSLHEKASYISESHSFTQPLPFVSRSLRRSNSLASMSSLSNQSGAPSLPPLDLRPPFPGPHPNINSDGKPTLRHNNPSQLPTIPGSVAGSEYMSGFSDNDSLHAESFVTASEHENRSFSEGHTQMQSAHSNHSVPPDAETLTGSDSFISRRWDRDSVNGGSERATFRIKALNVTYTPAFWTFWLGFLCPFLWLVGGWHFTHHGEQPPMLTFWEFYFNAGFWKEAVCCRKRRVKVMGQVSQGRGRHRGQTYPLPLWITERQNSEDKLARLQDTNRCLRNISCRYPFVPRSPLHPTAQGARNAQLRRRLATFICFPNRILDRLYGVRLRHVDGRRERGRLMVDPWIQRCRYAFIYWFILLVMALCIVAIVLGVDSS